ncbi:MAG: hypothetical protein AB8F95_11485 [Bacteroidia bacterium]
MKNYILILALLSFCVISFAQNRVMYTHPQFENLASEHSIVAVMPPKTIMKLRPKQMAKMTPDQLLEMEKSESQAVQLAIESYFLRRQQRKQFAVTFQEVTKTNALLKQNGISYENMDEYTSEQLCAILGVDAVVSGNLVLTKPMSEAASAALGLLVGFWGDTNGGMITLSIHNAKDGALLWRYGKALTRSLGSDTNTVIKAFMRKSARQFPYEDL